MHVWCVFLNKVWVVWVWVWTPQHVPLSSGLESGRITLSPWTIHWLKIPERIQFRLCVLTYRCLHRRTSPSQSNWRRLTCWTKTPRRWFRHCIRNTSVIVRFRWRPHESGRTTTWRQGCAVAEFWPATAEVDILLVFIPCLILVYFMPFVRLYAICSLVQSSCNIFSWKMSL